MGYRTYTDEDKASVFVALSVNEGNITRTSRDTGIPQSTVRDWKKEWEAEGVPEELRAEAQEQATEIVAVMERVRSKALNLLEGRLHEAKPKELATIFGIVDDKIRLAIGLATSRSVTVHALPSPAEMRELFVGMVQGAIEAQSMRQQDIVDAEIIEPAKALNRSKE